MTQQLGREMVLEVNTGTADSPTFTVVGAGEDINLTKTISSVDLSVVDGANPGNPIVHVVAPGKKMFALSGTWTLVDSTSEKAITEAMETKTAILGVKVTIPTYRTYTGDVMVMEQSFSGGKESALTWTASMEFTGAVTETEISS